MNQQLFQVNFDAATQKKKEELHSRQVQLEKEREMLKHNRMEWVKKLGAREEEMKQRKNYEEVERKGLELDWMGWRDKLLQMQLGLSLR